MSKLPIALQLYTVRDQMEKDAAGTLNAVADIGYEFVEVAGLAGLSAADFRKLADAAGLKVISGHMSVDDIEGTARDAKILGLTFVGCGMPGPLREKGEEGFRTHAKNLEKAAYALKEHGITLTYHNHSFEFVKFGDKYGLDILYGESAPDSLQAQFDVYWVQHGGEPPAEYITKWAARCKTIHLKDMLPDEAKTFAEVGEGILDWPAIFEAAAKIKPAWYIVEQDRCQRPSLESAKMSFDNLKKWGYV